MTAILGQILGGLIVLSVFLAAGWFIVTERQFRISAIYEKLLRIVSSEFRQSIGNECTRKGMLVSSKHLASSQSCEYAVPSYS
jgi:hypothetical protein